MPALLVSLLCRPFRAIARCLPSRAPALAWKVENGVSVAVWTAPEAEADTVSRVHLEIRRNEALRQPFVLIVSPEGYMSASFVVGDLETAHSLALRQLAVARRLPALRPQPPAAEAVRFDPAPETAAFRPATESMVGGRDEATFDVAGRVVAVG